MRAVFVVPVDDQRSFVLLLRLFFRDRRQEQDVFERPVKSFDHGDATMFANGAEPRQDALRLTPVC